MVGQGLAWEQEPHHLIPKYLLTLPREQKDVVLLLSSVFQKHLTLTITEEEGTLFPATATKLSLGDGLVWQPHPKARLYFLGEEYCLDVLADRYKSFYICVEDVVGLVIDVNQHCVYCAHNGHTIVRVSLARPHCFFCSLQTFVCIDVDDVLYGCVPLCPLEDFVSDVTTVCCG